MGPDGITLRVFITVVSLAISGVCKGSPAAQGARVEFDTIQKNPRNSIPNKSRTQPAPSAKARSRTSPAAWQNNPLAAAAARGDLEKVRSLLKGGADVNAETGGTVSALEVTAGYGHTEVVKALIDAGANVKGRPGRKAMKVAVLNGHTETAKLLIKSGVQVKGPAKNEYIPIAIGAGHPEMLPILHSADSP